MSGSLAKTSLVTRSIAVLGSPRNVRIRPRLRLMTVSGGLAHEAEAGPIDEMLDWVQTRLPDSPWAFTSPRGPGHPALIRVLLQDEDDQMAFDTEAGAKSVEILVRTGTYVCAMGVARLPGGDRGVE